MKTFLQLVAQDLYCKIEMICHAQLSYSLTKRASLFFNEHLAKSVRSTSLVTGIFKYQRIISAFIGC